MSDVLLVDVSDRIATMTMNRPEARNALNRELQRSLYRTARELDERDDVDVIILTGTDPAFSAGVDLKELGAGSGDSDSARALVADEIRRGPMPPTAKPIIGAVNGVAVTGGFEVALNCDFLVASEHARFADTHSRVGIMPGWGLTVLLAEAVGVRRARELSATGNYLDAETALAWGLVNHVVPHDELLPFCRKLAADIGSNDQPGVRRMLQTYDEILASQADEGWAIEGRVSREWSKSFDPAEVERRRQNVVARGRSQIG